MTNDDIVTFYGKVRVSAITPGNSDAGGVSYYAINTSYINNTRKPIRAKLRSNLEILVPSVAIRKPYSHDETFIVRKELVVQTVGIESVRQYFANLPESNGELELFRKVFLQVYESLYKFSQTQDLRCSIEYVFTEQDLNEHGGIFYHDALDTLFKFGTDKFEVNHPNSPEGRQDQIEQDAISIRDEHGFVFWVEIIDSAGKYGDRYFSICNQIYKVSPRVDRNRPDGLYIVSSKPSNGRISSTDIQQRVFPLENADKELGMYPTFELAQTQGDIAGQRKREMQEKEHEFILEKQSWEREKLQMQREAEERNRRIKDMEMNSEHVKRALDELKSRQEHLMEIQRLQAKEKYDERQAERKDATEMIKFLPTILAAIGTILMAWRAMKSN